MEQVELEFIIKAITENFQSGIKEVNDKLDESKKKFDSVTGSVLKAQIGFASISSVFDTVKSQVGSSVDSVMELGLQTRALTAETGMSAEQVTGFIAVLDKFGIGNNQAETAMRTFSKVIVDTKDETGKTSTALDKLGISVKDAHGNLIPTNDLLLQTADKFKDMQNGAEKTALATSLFGKAAIGMLPLLNQGSDGIKNLEEKANEAGLVLSGQNISQINDYIKKQQDMQEAISGVKLQIGLALMPMISNVIGKIQEWIEKNGGIKQIMDEKVIPVIKDVSKIVGDFVKIIIEIIKWIDKHKEGLKELAMVVLPVVAAILIMIKIFEAARAIIGVIKDIQAAWVVLSGIIEANPIVLIITLIIAAGLLLITHWNLVKKVASDVWQWIQKVAQDAFDWIKNNWPLIVGILTGPIGFAIAEIIKNWDSIKTGISDVINSIKKAFDGAINWLVDVGKDIINGLINGIESMIGAVGNSVKKVASGAVNSIKGLLGINSPSTIFMEIGQNMGQGLINGIGQMQKAAQNATADLANATISGFGSNTTNNNQSIAVNVSTGNFYGQPATAGADLGNSLANQLRLASRGF